MLTFNSKIGITAETPEQVRERIRAQWIAAFAGDGLPPLDVSQETPAGQLIDAETALVIEADDAILNLAAQFNPATADGVWQDALAKIYFLTRKVSEPTLVTCVCSGLQGTAIPAGALAQDADGNMFIATASAVIPSAGSVSIIFRLAETGPIYVASGAVNKIITVIPGWDSITNPTAGVTGRNEETRAEFEARRVQSVAANGHGTLGAIYGSISQLPGILACVALENISGVPVEKNGVTIEPHSIFISVYGGEDAAIAETIYRKKDAGCGTTGNYPINYSDPDYSGASYTYKITRPATVPFGVRVSLRMTPGTPANIADDIKNAVLKNFNGQEGTTPRVTMAQKVYASRFYCSVIAAGAQDLTSIEIAYPLSGGAWVDAVDIPADQLPVLSADDIIINFLEG